MRRSWRFGSAARHRWSNAGIGEYQNHITGVGEVMSGRVLLFDSLGQENSNELKLSIDPENQKKIKKLETIKLSKMCRSPMQKKGIEIKELNPQ